MIQKNAALVFGIIYSNKFKGHAFTKMKNIKFILILLTIFTATIMNWQCSANKNSDKWPTRGWITSTPKKEGMNPDSLLTLSNLLESGDLGYIDGMLVIRNGKIIFEEHYTNNYDSLFETTNTQREKYNYYDSEWHPYYKGTKLHTMQSVSKSFTSAAIGIAIKNGHISGTNEKIMNYFDEYESAIPDPRRDAITIKDVLTMTTGILWDEFSMPYTDTSSTCVQMEATDDWVKYVIDQPMAFDPGEKWEYSSGATMLLSHIIERASGQDLALYLEKNLFSELGIQDYFWKHIPSGLTDAEGGLYLTPRNLAKFGYLYLNNGNWNGKQILPQNWVTLNTSKPLDTLWPTFKYGYQWWLIPYGENQITMLASGLGGQIMLVIPELNIVAVFTGWNIYDIPALDSWMVMHKLINAVHE